MVPGVGGGVQISFSFSVGLCEIRKRESQCSYLAFLDISMT